jgi:anti-sigma B factor antagonist
MQLPSEHGRDHTDRSRAVPLPTRSTEGESTADSPFTDGLRIEVSVLGSTRTVGPEGEWDLSGTPAAAQAVATTLEQNPEHLVLDLSRLTFMDSSGVHAAIQLSERSRTENFRLAIVPGPRAVQRLFDICQLTESLPFTTPA